MGLNITLFSTIASYFKSRSNIESMLLNLNGGWKGRAIYFPTSNYEDASYKDIHVTFTFDEVRLFSSIVVKSVDETIDSQYFFRCAENDNTTLAIANRFNEDIGYLKVNYSDRYFTIRGKLVPSNDQITGLLKGENFVLSITDQFSENVTTFKLETSEKMSMVSYYNSIFLFIAVVAAISVGLYKMSDLSDIIQPEEAKYTEMVKIQAQREQKIKEARELLKKMEAEAAKQKAAENEGKITEE